MRPLARPSAGKASRGLSFFSDELTYLAQVLVYQCATDVVAAQGLVVFLAFPQVAAEGAVTFSARAHLDQDLRDIG